MSENNLPEEITADEECHDVQAQPRAEGRTEMAQDSAVVQMGLGAMHYPDHLEWWVGVHKAKFPELYPPDVEVPSGDIDIPLTVVGSGHVVRGIPFAEGELRDVDDLILVWPDGRQHVLSARAAQKWGDGSVRVAHIAFYANDVEGLRLRTGTRELGSRPAISLPPLQIEGVAGWDAVDGVDQGWLAPVAISDFRVARVGDIKIEVHSRGFASGWRRFVTVTNIAAVTHDNGRATCMSFGGPGDRRARIKLLDVELAQVRWAHDNGIAESWAQEPGLVFDGILRSGERVYFEIASDVAEPPYCEIPAEYVLSTGAFGRLAPVKFEGVQLGHDMRTLDAIEGFADRMALSSSNKSPRNWGDVRRDFESNGSDPNSKHFHNNEYDWLVGMLEQHHRFGGLTQVKEFDVSGVARKAWLVAEAGAIHQATVDICHTFAGASQMTWMMGAPFQHDKHGGTGENKEHRGSFPPNAGHFTGRICLQAWYLTANPVLMDGAEALKTNCEWRIAAGDADNNGPERSNTNGELRAPGSILGIALDWYEFTHDDEWWERCQKVVSETMQREYFTAGGDRPGSWRYKPWMAAHFGKQLRRLSDHHGANLQELAVLQRLLFETGVVVDPGSTHLNYEVSQGIPERPTHDRDMPGSFWNTWAADVMCDFDAEMADGLYFDGRWTWYPGFEMGKWMRALSAGGHLSAGNVYLTERG